MSSASQRYSSATRACKHCKVTFWSESGRQLVCADCKRSATRERMSRWIARNPEVHRARSAASSSPRTRERQNATAAVYRAIKRGALIRGVCEACGVPNAQAHHAIEHRKKESTHVVG